MDFIGLNLNFLDLFDPAPLYLIGLIFSYSTICKCFIMNHRKLPTQVITMYYEYNYKNKSMTE